MVFEKTIKRRPATEKRRREILDAALSCFLKKGFAGTTIEDIRTLSKASHGSIYHQFRSKDEIAFVLFIEGMQNYHQQVIKSVESANNAREVLHSIIHTHIRITVEDPEVSRYLTQISMADDVGDIEEQYEKLNDDFAEDIWLSLKPYVEKNEIRQLPLELYFSIIIGPGAHLSRSWLRKRIKKNPMDSVEELTDAAWNSLRIS
jgi:AcrR family transcriptional regulator